MTHEQRLKNEVKLQVIDTQFNPIAIYNEFVISHGYARIDIGMIEVDCFHGFELKTEQDSLAKLPHQIEHYNQFFDLIYAVVASRHLDKTLQMVPPFWGVYEAVYHQDNISIKVIRRAQRNTLQDAVSVLNPIWKKELVEILGAKIPIDYKVRKKTALELREQIATLFPINEIKSRAQQKILMREPTWRKDCYINETLIKEKQHEWF